MLSFITSCVSSVLFVSASVCQMHRGRRAPHHAQIRHMHDSILKILMWTNCLVTRTGPWARVFDWSRQIRAQRHTYHAAGLDSSHVAHWRSAGMHTWDAHDSPQQLTAPCVALYASQDFPKSVQSYPCELSSPGHSGLAPTMAFAVSFSVSSCVQASHQCLRTFQAYSSQPPTSHIQKTKIWRVSMNAQCRAYAYRIDGSWTGTWSFHEL